MSTIDNEELEIQNLMNQAPTSSEAPGGLKDRIRAMAASTKVRQPSVWPGRIAFAGAGIAVLAAVVLTMTPAKAMGFQLVVDAVDKTNAMELSIQGKDGHQFVIAMVDGKFGMRTDEGSIMQFDNKGLQIYDPSKNTVTELGIGGIVDPKQIAKEMNKGLSEGFKEMDLKKMMAEFEAKYGKGNIQISPIVHRFGKSTYDVSMQKPGEPEQVHMTVNADTNLPEKIEVDKMSGGDWKPDTVIELKFGKDVDADLSNPKFPADAKHVNLNIGDMIQNGLKGLPKMGSDSDKD